MIFVEGDTDKLFFDRLVQYYRQTSSVPIASCEVRNMHGVSRYSSKLAGKLKGQIIPSAVRKGMEVQAVCCSYDTDVFEYAERPVVDWSRVAAEVGRLGIREFCEVKVEQMMEDWLLDDLKGVCGYLKLKKMPASVKGSNGFERILNLYKQANNVYVKGLGAGPLIAALDMGVIRAKRKAALEELERMLGVRIVDRFITTPGGGAACGPRGGSPEG